MPLVAVFTLLNLLVLLGTVAVFGLTLKLYTEYAKDKFQDRRKADAGQVPSTTGSNPSAVDRG